MILETQQKLEKMLRGALLAKDDEEALANVRGLARGLKAAGLDLHKIGIHDAKDGHATQAGANAIKQKRALVDAFNTIARSRKQALAKLRETEEGTFKRTIGTGEGAGSLKKEMKQFIRDAGEKGCTRQSIYDRFPGNPNVPKRISELIYNESFAFEAADRIHLEEFGPKFPKAYGEFVAVRKKKLEVK